MLWESFILKIGTGISLTWQDSLWIIKKKKLWICCKCIHAFTYCLLWGLLKATSTWSKQLVGTRRKKTELVVDKGHWGKMKKLKINRKKPPKDITLAYLLVQFLKYLSWTPNQNWHGLYMGISENFLFLWYWVYNSSLHITNQSGTQMSIAQTPQSLHF